MLPLRSAPQPDLPVFSVPVRWTLRVLAWMAFGVSAYLVWHVVNQAPVAGCGVGSESGCDMVLSSSWSKWLGLPVAVPGLACYAALAALSVVLGVQHTGARRWITTLFLMLGVLAAIASLWFLAIQVFVIGHFCPYCVVTDLCGVAIGLIASWSTVRWLSATRYLRKPRAMTTGLMALRTTLPAGNRSTPTAVPPKSQHDRSSPSLAFALGGAGVIAVLLIGGQILFPAKSYEMQQVALTDSIEMNGANGDEPSEPQPIDPDPRVAMRVPPESGTADTEKNGDEAANSDVVAAGYEEPIREQESGSEPPAESPPPDAETPNGTPSHQESGRERLVEFLGGKLTLDVHKHPLIGSPQAPHVIVEMVSYNCKHCRATHRKLKQALSRYGDQVAIIVMVIPFERECNKLITSSAASNRGACSTARMALGVAALKPAAFGKFHDWLMADEDKPPELEAIVSRAYSLVPRDRLRELSGSDQLRKQIAAYIDLFATLRNQNAGNKEFGLPVQILGDHVMSGTVEKASDLYRAWEEHLGVKQR